MSMNTGEKGFTIIEVIVTLILVGITAVMAGMWIVSIANGYIFAKKNMATAQKAQLAMTRIEKEFKAISAVNPGVTTATSITYTRPDIASGSVNGTISLDGSLLKINGYTLTDNVSAFTLAYCDNVTSTSCPAAWSSTSRIIVITLSLVGAENVQSTFTQRVTPRNL